MRRFHIYIGFIVWLLTSLFAVSCTDELEGNGYTPNSSSNLHVLVPTVLSSRGINPDDASGLPTYNATVDECQINDLTLYAFPTGNEGKLLKETLPAPLATMMVEPHVANYQLNIEPGTYHIYVVANMNKVLSGQTKPIQTEDDLKKIVLGYGFGAVPGMPVSTNIPMIYEPKDVNGTIINTKIEKGGKKYTEVAANLKFTCVKVKLNLLFDPAAEGSSFNGKSYSIKDILAQKLSPSTTLSWNGAFSNSNVSTDYVKGFENEVYATPSEASNKGGYYKEGEWTEVAANANVNDKDIITLVPSATPTAAPQNTAAKWLFQGTYYLPERYIADASQQSTLKVNGFVNGNIENNYTIKLGHRQDESSTSKEVPTFPRGTYYEIIGKIKSLGNMTLDCNVSVEDWTPVTIDADFNHTTLWVSKTKAEVTSTTNDYISYKSNAGYVEFGCDKTMTINGNPEAVIVESKRSKDASGNGIIEFRVNPKIPISAFKETERTGDTKVWLKANNLKKYIDVHYDVTPYLDVTKKVVIYYNKDKDSQNSRSIEWDTNLGGIKLEETELTKGKSTIEMNLKSSDAATGVFTVTAKTDPVTTTIYDLKVIPQNETTDVKYKTVRVIVRPPIGDYRIYFRAINDRSKYNGGNSSDNFKKILPEGGTNNWSDGWNEDAKDTSDPITKNHCIYVYTQIGETEDAPTGKGWIFTKGTERNGWPGEEMVADETNTGWYYKNFPENAQNVSYTNGADKEGPRTIKPGETLIMFSNNTDLDQGYSLHRCPHHLEPGIPLFDYEDREGWIVYDPTSDPIWHVYDNMPEIEDIEYKVYTPFELFGWYKIYGIASGEDQFKIWDTNAKNSWECKNVGNGWYKTTIKLKAVKGEHEKNILLKKENNDNSPTITLFNGNSFKDDTGYYKDGKWYQGKPKGVTE